MPKTLLSVASFVPKSILSVLIEKESNLMTIFLKFFHRNVPCFLHLPLRFRSAPMSSDKWLPSVGVNPVSRSVQDVPCASLQNLHQHGNIDVLKDEETEARRGSTHWKISESVNNGAVTWTWIVCLQRLCAFYYASQPMWIESCIDFWLSCNSHL